jgi:hypothetical protein
MPFFGILHAVPWNPIRGSDTLHGILCPLKRHSFTTTSSQNMDEDTDVEIDISTLLKHDPEYGILICLKCRYAVQRSTLDNHLLRHKIYREQRKQLVNSVSQLTILEPDTIRVPAPTSPAIGYLPKFSGLRCSAPHCGHLTVSMKRIKLHWSQVHESATRSPAYPNLASNVILQTFFRGNKVRYFEVESVETTSPHGYNTEELDAHNCNSSSHDIGPDDAHSHDTDCQPTPLAPPTTQSRTLPLTIDPFDLSSLPYFHHFITTTSLTLPFINSSPSVEHYWQNEVVQRALQRNWLMYGLLALSACHLATLADDTSAKQIHCERENQYASRFESQFLAAGLDQVAHQMRIQVRYLLRLAQHALHGNTTPQSRGGKSSFRDTSITSSLRVCLSLERIRSIPLQTRTPRDIRDVGLEDPLTILKSLSSRMFKLLKHPMSGEDAFCILQSIDLLKESCEGVPNSVHDGLESSWDAAATWLKSVSGRFHAMLDDSDDLAALLIVAYWSAVMVIRA